MKLNTGSELILDTNTEGSLQFQITANATAFQILSSGLYSDKVRAVIRELACNANDAHIAAGKADLPITVILPTAQSSTFTVRDYGTGLSHEQVVGLYTNYFSSDKRSSNSFTGGFGLGSKSPFAYTDNFSIVARQDGIERVYLCNLNDDGAPSLTKVSEQEVPTESNGVEVSFAVKPADIKQFHEKAMLVLQWFDTRPDIINGSVDWPKKDYLVEEGHYAIPTKHHEANRMSLQTVGSALVKMGNVVYPLDWTRLMGEDASSETLVVRGMIELRLPIGAAAIAASREELQYDPKTCSNIKRVLKSVVNDFNTHLVECITPTGDVSWAGGCIAAHLRENASYYLSTELAKLLENSTIPNKHNAHSLLVATGMKVPNVGGIAGVAVHWLRRNALMKKVLNGGYYKTTVAQLQAEMSFGPNTVIFVNDSSQVTERLRVAKEMGVVEHALIFSAPKDLHKEMLEQAVKCSEQLGGMPILYSSTLPVENPTRVGSAGVSTKTKPVFVPVDDREVAFFDFTDGTLYECPLSEVPEEGRYYMTKVTAGSQAGWYDVGGTKLWDCYSPENMQLQLGQFAVGLQALINRCPAWQVPRGVLLVRPVDIKRLKLLESGFVQLGVALDQAMKSPDIIPVVNDLAAEYDNIVDYAYINGYTPWFAVLRKYLVATNNPASMWAMLKQAGLDTDMRGYMLANKQSAHVRDAVAAMQQRLQQLGLECGKPMRQVVAMNEALQTKYPLLMALNRQQLVEPKMLSLPDDVTRLLGAVFGVMPTP